MTGKDNSYNEGRPKSKNAEPEDSKSEMKCVQERGHERSERKHRRSTSVNGRAIDADHTHSREKYRRQQTSDGKERSMRKRDRSESVDRSRGRRSQSGERHKASRNGYSAHKSKERVGRRNFDEKEQKKSSYQGSRSMKQRRDRSSDSDSSGSR